MVTQKTPILKGILLHKLSHDITAKQAKVVEKLELTTPQSRVIVFLVNRLEEDTYQLDVERYFNLKGSTISEILKNLEKKGFIQKNYVMDDKRYRRLVLTERGLEVSDKVIDAMLDIEDKITLGMSPEEKGEFLNLIQKALNNMEV